MFVAESTAVGADVTVRWAEIMKKVAGTKWTRKAEDRIGLRLKIG